MNLSEKNGQPSMEEILASIRRIIAEEPLGGEPLIDLNNPRPASPDLLTAAPLQHAEEHGEFELPSMFRPSAQPSPERHTPLLGRLTDALRGGGASESKVLAEEAAPSEPEAPIASLSSLKLARDQVTESRAFETEPAPVQRVASAVPDEIVPRKMAAFKDTRFTMMTSAPAPTSVVNTGAHTAPVFAAPTQAVDFSTIIPSQMERPGVATFGTPPRHDADAVEMAALPSIPAAVMQSDPAALTPPPPPLAMPQLLHPAVAPVIPQQAPASSGPQSLIEDATADLLRPMLRQWLADNMPRMVEKALHIEVAESVRTVKKFNGH